MGFAATESSALSFTFVILLFMNWMDRGVPSVVLALMSPVMLLSGL